METAKKIITFTTSYFFPVMVRIVSALALLVGISLMLTHQPFYIGLIVVLITLPIILARYTVVVDVNQGIICESFNVGGLRFNTMVTKSKALRIMIKKEKYSQTTNSRVSSITVKFDQYNAYLVHETGTILLGGHKKHEKAVRKFGTLASKLKIPMV